METALLPAVPEQARRAWEQLTNTAIRGLRATYGQFDPALPRTREWDGERVRLAGRDVRYALISLLGLGKHRDDAECRRLSHSLWQRIEATPGPRELSPGDYGLGLWARALHGESVACFDPARAMRHVRNKLRVCDSIERAWLLLGADHLLLAGAVCPNTAELAEEAKRALLSLYCPDTSLFYRHDRFSPVSRRIACFANQIYPLMALSVHARRTGNQEAADVATAVADKLCREQGELGQWWWLWDVDRGEVVDGYPVYSVHQDGMAPMALIEAGRASRQSHAMAIDRGCRWLFGRNETNESLLRVDDGMIWRDVHRNGVGRAHRMVRGTLWCCGVRRAGVPPVDGTRFTINQECRPYHLGWVLYAAGLMREIQAFI